MLLLTDVSTTLAVEEPKRVFGKTFPVKVGKTMNYDEVRQAALKKWEDYDRKFTRDRGYILVYPDGNS